jgi:Acyltransferase
MKRIFGFLTLASVKTLSHLFFWCEVNWLTPEPHKLYDEARLIVLLNHTSLYEPLFLQAIPYSYLWHLAGHLNVPGADITLNRPIVGRFWKLMMPNIATVSRRKDASWANYLNSINTESVVMIAPEGRMKRPNGLDKNGNTMTVKGGVADILENMNSGKMILCLSGGLHHVQAPGQVLPRVFKTIKLNLAAFDIPEYKKTFEGLGPRERKLAVVADLQKRLETCCP